MSRNIHFIKNLNDHAIPIDQKRLSVGTHVLFAVHTLFDPDTVRLNNFLIGIGDQCQRQIIFRNKLLMRFLIVYRNAEYLNVLGSKIVVRITERACFLRSARCVVFWIEPEHDPLAFEIGKPDRVSVLNLCIKIGCLVAFFEHNLL